MIAWEYWDCVKAAKQLALIMSQKNYREKEFVAFQATISIPLQLHDLSQDVAKSGSSSSSVPLDSVHKTEEKPKGIMGTLSALVSSLPLIGWEEVRIQGAVMFCLSRHWVGKSADKPVVME